VGRAALEEDRPRTVAEFEPRHARQPERWEFVDKPAAPDGAGVDDAHDHQGEPVPSTPPCPGRARVRRSDRQRSDPYRRDLRDSRCGRDLCAHRLVDPGRRRADNHRRDHVAIERADGTLRKWFSYREIASLKHHLVLAQARRLVQIQSRAGDLWRERFVSEDAIGLDDPPVRIEVADLYAATEMAA
jgi:hypothetical protein